MATQCQVGDNVYAGRVDEEGVWTRGRLARRARDGCPPWHTLAEACTLLACGVTLRTSLPVALVVGTMLSVVNQGALVVAGGATSAVWLKVAFNYAVPFLVSSIGFLGAGRVRADRSIRTVGPPSR